MHDLKSGTYHITAQGYEGNTTPLEIEIENNKIKSIKALKEMTKDGLEDAVFTKLPQKMIKNQTFDVDGISGASYSSRGLIEAVRDVIEQAGGKAEDFSSTRSDTQEFVIGAHQNENIAEYSKWRQAPSQVDKTIDTDFLIVGAGIAGLAAAVQAAEDGMQTTVIEKNDFVAGNGGGVEGIFGINTQMQKDSNIHVEKEKIIAREMELSQYRVDGSFWVDLVNNSADNIDWLLKQGVQLTKVDDYHGTCSFPTFHWFKDGVASSGYVPFMKKRADELGVNFILGAAADSIIFEGDQVKGIFAKTDDGNIKINAKATLLATGGVGHNGDLIAKQGWSTKNLHYCSMPSNTGDGYMMSMSLGAKDMLEESPEFMMNYIQAFPHRGKANLSNDPINGIMTVPSGGPELWVNQDGVRLVNENVKKYNLLYQRMAIRSTKATYAIFNQKIYDQITNGVKDADKILEESVKTNEGNSLYKENNFEDLARDVGLPVDTFVKTVKEYNKFAHQGKDEEFDKDKESLVPIEEGPYYIARLDPSNLIGVGGVGSNRDFEVIDDNYNKINGLYIAGMDSTMQYRSVYTITLGGSACAHNVNSGRHAAMNAKKYIEENAGVTA